MKARHSLIAVIVVSILVVIVVFPLCVNLWKRMKPQKLSYDKEIAEVLTTIDTDNTWYHISSPKYRDHFTGNTKPLRECLRHLTQDLYIEYCEPIGKVKIAPMFFIQCCEDRYNIKPSLTILIYESPDLIEFRYHDKVIAFKIKEIEYAAFRTFIGSLCEGVNPSSKDRR